MIWAKRAEGMTQVVEFLPGKYKTLSSNPNTTKNNNNNPPPKKKKKE
jgi:hypothetical protein